MSGHKCAKSSEEFRCKITTAVKNAQPKLLARLLARDNVPDLDLSELYDVLVNTSYTNCRPVNAHVDCFRVLVTDCRLPLSIELLDDIIVDVRQMTDLLAVVLELGVPAHRERLQNSMFAVMAYGLDKMLKFIVAQPFIDVNEESVNRCRLLHWSIVGRGHASMNVKLTSALLAAPSLDVNAYAPNDELDMITAMTAADRKCVSPTSIEFMYAPHDSAAIFAGKSRDVLRVRMLLGHDDIDIHTLSVPGEWKWDEYDNLLMFKEEMVLI